MLRLAWRRFKSCRTLRGGPLQTLEERGAEGQGALAEEPVDVVRAPGTRGGLLSNETGSIAKHWSSGWESRDVVQ